ncbi:hypothetical protein EIN_496840 [Entamoeba invadens IP1]|uniref:Uncharacterized protein n=1 Tax=Entamoeba invadens IP1 TaxID=370355 RepID=A0A0A1TZU1_ENTIV|nr:hypothetical protein EIN_496840 [Entamoeba invadens IP1]ELP87129.1 hypothetical protein EIN_496840 [Entamoeba invadens IP1]|eukprot:XP_004253900.1 hypothetical protein EIN_496840 [Entamoeba invadens IP1]
MFVFLILTLFSLETLAILVLPKTKTVVTKTVPLVKLYKKQKKTSGIIGKLNSIENENYMSIPMEERNYYNPYERSPYDTPSDQQGTLNANFVQHVQRNNYLTQNLIKPNCPQHPNNFLQHRMTQQNPMLYNSYMQRPLPGYYAPSYGMNYGYRMNYPYNHPIYGYTYGSPYMRTYPTPMPYSPYSLL